jgi:molybdopterin molybdotransferase
MLDVATALQHIAAETRPLPAVDVALEDAPGRVLAAPLQARERLPGFDNSAMDGFALAAGGTTIAARSEFDVGGESAAGDGASRAASGSAWEIMTGAPLPAGLDSVIPVEQVEVLVRDDAGRARRLRLQADVRPGQHVRLAGEDIDAGAPLFDAGTPIEAQHLMMLAALGIGRVPVVRRPRVAIICTGRELIDDPQVPLAAGQIRNSNGPFLAARIKAAGAEPCLRATVGDAVEPFLATLADARARGADVIISTGAVSMGRYDFVPQALQRLGARTVFHKLAIRPGKPLLFAVLPDGALFFGLPGNPASSAVGLRFFVEAALRRMLGMGLERPLRIALAAPVQKKAGLCFFTKAALAFDGAGRARVEVLAGQESFRMLPLARANCWAVLPAPASDLDAGTLVDVYPPGHLHSFGDAPA